LVVWSDVIYPLLENVDLVVWNGVIYPPLMHQCQQPLQPAINGDVMYLPLMYQCQQPFPQPMNAHCMQQYLAHTQGYVVH